MLAFHMVLACLIVTCNCGKVRRQILRMHPNYLHRARYLDVRRNPTKIKEHPRFDAPKIVCGPDYIGIALTSQFTGRIYASHKDRTAECVKYYNMATSARFQLSLGNSRCGVKREKQNTPQPGVTYNLRVIVSFDYEHLTEDDKIFDLQCVHNVDLPMRLEAFYDSQEVLQKQLLYSTDVPECKYSLHLNSIDGTTVENAKVGDMVYHRWECASDDMHFRVYRCFVHNGNKQSFMLVDDKGCSLDEDILPHPSYDLETNTVYAPSKAFRFSKSKRVHFNCLLAVCPRSDPECMQSIPPKCRRSQQKRHLPDDVSVEERLLRIHAALNGLNFTQLIAPSSVEISTGTISVNDESEVNKVSLHSSQNELCWDSVTNWLIALIISNFLSTTMAIVACIRLVKNRYAIDITQLRSNLYNKRYYY